MPQQTAAKYYQAAVGRARNYRREIAEFATDAEAIAWFNGLGFDRLDRVSQQMTYKTIARKPKPHPAP